MTVRLSRQDKIRHPVSMALHATALLAGQILALTFLCPMTATADVPERATEPSDYSIMLVAENLDASSLRTELASYLGASVYGLEDQEDNRPAAEIFVARVGNMATIVIRSRGLSEMRTLRLGSEPVLALTHYLTSLIRALDVGQAATVSAQFRGSTGVINPFDQRATRQVASEVIDTWRIEREREQSRGLSRPPPGRSR